MTPAKNKSQAAQEFYEELKQANDPDIRKKFIARCISELNMGAAGAATYYQNAKTKHEGGKIKVYGKAGKAQAAKAASSPVNDDPWSVIHIEDGLVVECAVYVGQDTAEEAYNKQGGADFEGLELVRGSVPVGSPYTPDVDE